MNGNNETPLTKSAWLTSKVYKTLWGHTNATVPNLLLQRSSHIISSQRTPYLHDNDHVSAELVENLDEIETVLSQINTLDHHNLNEEDLNAIHKKKDARNADKRMGGSCRRVLAPATATRLVWAGYKKLEPTTHAATWQIYWLDKPTSDRALNPTSTHQKGMHLEQMQICWPHGCVNNLETELAMTHQL